MPHQCVRCNKLYPDGSSELLRGCPSCGGKFFFYIQKEDMEQAKEITQDLTSKDKDQIEQDVMDIVGGHIDSSQPVFLDFESIRILKPGSYELDLVQIFKGKPLVYKLEDGKYIIDLVSTFQAKDKTLGEKNT